MVNPSDKRAQGENEMCRLMATGETWSEYKARINASNLKNARGVVQDEQLHRRVARPNPKTTRAQDEIETHTKSMAALNYRGHTALAAEKKSCPTHGTSWATGCTTCWQS